MNKNEFSMNEPVRLNRYLAQCGLGARRKCDELIAAGLIYVNGKKVTELGTKIVPSIDKVEHHGTYVTPMVHFQYFAYHKTDNVMVTKIDPENRTTIYDKLKSKGSQFEHMRYVGRLDYHSEGLLLLTNDGEIIHALTHPRFHIKKVYSVQLNRPLAAVDIKRMLDGVESNGQILHAGEVTIETDPPAKGENWYEVVLFEGKNRQIRRMFEALDYSIFRLIRKQFGSVKLGDLKPGEVRTLTEREIGALRNTGYKDKKNEKSSDI